MADEGSLKIVIVTPEGEKLAGEADEIVAPGHLGQFGVMPGHIAFFTASEPGLFVAISGGRRSTWAVGKGYIEIEQDEVQLLVQSAEKAVDIDVERARRAKERAEKKLAELEGNLDDPQWAEYTRRLKRANARLEAADAASAVKRN